MRLKFLGTGDAFGSGGRLNTCFFVDRGEASFLVDCGASAMISIRRFDVDPNRIGAIVVSHLHGDHFGGLPFFILDAQLVSRRTRPLVIAGPKGVGARLFALMEALFPGSSQAERRFALAIVELEPGHPSPIPEVGLRATGHLVEHASGAPSLGLRLECDGRILAYTGDTEWVENLVRVGSGADLLIAEAYSFERKVRHHLDFATLRRNAPRIDAKRIILTHMSADMLARAGSAHAGFEFAADGLTIDLDQRSR
jgi:ribonuclease BN (tRNA processing enzyme)